MMHLRMGPESELLINLQLRFRLQLNF